MLILSVRWNPKVNVYFFRESMMRKLHGVGHAMGSISCGIGWILAGTLAFGRGCPQRWVPKPGVDPRLETRPFLPERPGPEAGSPIPLRVGLK